MALPVALRIFRSRPGPTAAIVLSVGVAIGALVATFSLVDAVLLAPLPFPDSQAIVVISEGDAHRPDERLAVTVNTFRVIEATRDVLVDQAAIQTTAAPQVWAGDSVPRELRALGVTPNFFEVLGVTCAAGRTFRAEDARATTPPMIVSHRFWTDSLGGDERVVGSQVLLNGRSYTVMGVAPRGFAFADPTVDVWWPVELPRNSLQRGLLIIARLRPGVSAQTAEQRLQAALKTNWIAAQRDTRLRVASVANEAVRAVRQTLWLLLFACALLLTMAWANAITLRAMHAATRASELAVRSALGATRARVLRHIAVESAALTVVIGALGIIAAVITLRVAIVWLSGDMSMPRVDTARIGLRSVAVIGGVLVATWALIALPLWRHVWPATPVDVLRGGPTTLIGARQGMVLHGLVAAQFAVAFIELAAAVLLVGTAARVARVDLGFPPEQVVTLRVVLPPVPGSDAAATTARRLDRFEAMRETFRRLPGVVAAGGVRGLPLSQPLGTRSAGYLQTAGTQFDVVGYRLPHTPRTIEELPTAEYRIASAGYLSAMGIPRRQGRDFDERDGPASPPVVAVSEEVVKRLELPDNPIGQPLVFYWNGPAITATIVAVVGDVRNKALAERPVGTIYRPLTQMAFGNLTFAIRTTADSATIAAQAVAAVRRIEPFAVVSDVRPMTDVVTAAQSRQRLAAALLSTLCAISLGVAVLGVFSVVAFRVRVHLRELALRLALGADLRQIVLLVMRRSVVAAILGILIGVGATVASSRIVQSLFHDSGGIPLSMLAVAAIALVTIGLIAAYVPARRARTIDPGAALRTDG